MIPTAIAVAATAMLATGIAVAQQPLAAPAAPAPVDFSKVEIKTTDLGDNVYMLEGPPTRRNHCSNESCAGAET